MSSLHQQSGKPNWFMAYYDPEGFRRFRSTGTSNRRIADSIRAATDRASRLARTGQLPPEKALRLVRETGAAIAEQHGRIVANQAEDVLRATVEEFVRAAGGELTNYTVASWLESWLKGRADASEGTRQRYSGVIAEFVRALGKRAQRALTTLQPHQIEEHRDTIAKRRSPSTANLFLKVIKSAMSDAVAKRQLEFSPAEHVAKVAEDSSGRRPFNRDEINALLGVADAEWTTMILLAFYTGQRMQDCASLTWRNVDLTAGTITLTTRKMGRPMSIPLAATLQKHLLALAGDDADAPLCPTLNGKRSSWLSNQFHGVMAKAGLVEGRDHLGKGKGRDARRTLSAISFHSLRYSAVSELKNAGVSEAIAMDIVGHDSTAISRHYTKIADSTKADALNKLPVITK